MRIVEPVRRIDEAAARDHATGVFGTSHSVCALACFDSPATLGAEGAPMGPILSGGGLLCYDPFVIYNKREKYNVTNPNMTVVGEVGKGKALDVDTLVPTPDGWATMGDLRQGSKVFDENGQVCTVIDAWPVRYGRPCYEVVFDDGSVIVADEDHQWVTETYLDRSKHWGSKQQYQALGKTPLSTLAIRDTLLHNNQRNHSIPCAAPLAGRRCRLPVPPYAFGCWLGDGHAAGGRFTTADPEVDQHLREERVRLHPLSGQYLYAMRYLSEPDTDSPRTCVCGERFVPRHTRHFYHSPECRGPWWRAKPQPHERTFSGDLRLLGVLNNKHIPIVYLRSSVEQRRALLAGLLDTDGSCNASGSVQYTSTRQQLAVDVYRLVCSLGHKATMRRKCVKGRTEASSVAYIVTFAPSDEVFRLSRKLQRQTTVRRATTKRRYIVDVRPTTSRPVRCITVDSASHLYLAGEACVPTHNTTSIQVYLRRQHPFGRFIRVIDPRGEYRELARDLNGQTIRLSRDGGITLNPLESPETRHALLRSMASAAARRGLNEREPALLNVALDASGKLPILPVVLERLFYPTSEMAQRVGTTERRFANEARDVAMAMQPLCEGDLQGLFDDYTTADVDFSNQFIELDLSDLWDSQSLGILMACATSFLQSQIDAHYRTGDLVGQPPKSILVIDEAWKILTLPGIGEWLRERFKFSRKLAQQNIAIMHGFRDLDAAGNEGDQITKMAQGLVKDCGTFVHFATSAEDARQSQRLLGLSDVERDVLVGGLDRGCALWRIGAHRFIAFTHATESDLAVTSPDRAMTG